MGIFDPVSPVVGEPVVDDNALVPLPKGTFTKGSVPLGSKPGEVRRGLGAGFAGLRGNILGSSAELAGFGSFGAAQRTAAEQDLQNLAPPSDLARVIEDPAQVVPLTKFSAGNLGASVAASGGSAAALALISKLITGKVRAPIAALGPAGVSLLNEIGETYQIAREAGADDASARALKGGVPAAALDFVSLIGAASLFFGKGPTGLAAKLAAGLIGVPAFEALTETAQDAIKGFVGAGKVPESEELANTAFSTFLGAGVTLGVPSAAGSVLSSRKPGEDIKVTPEEAAIAEQAAVEPVEAPFLPPSPEASLPADTLLGLTPLADRDIREDERGDIFSHLAVPPEEAESPTVEAPVEEAPAPIVPTKGGLFAPVELDTDGRPVVTQPTQPTFSPFEAAAIDVAIKEGKLTEADVTRAIKNTNFGEREAIRRTAGLLGTGTHLAARLNEPLVPKAAPPPTTTQKLIVETQNPRKRQVSVDQREIEAIKEREDDTFIAGKVAASGLQGTRALSLGNALTAAIRGARDIDPSTRDLYLEQQMAAAMKGKIPKADADLFIEDYFANRAVTAPEIVTDKADLPVAAAAYSGRTEAMNDIMAILAAAPKLDNKTVKRVITAYVKALPEDRRSELTSDPQFLKELELEVRRFSSPNKELFEAGSLAGLQPGQRVAFVQWGGTRTRDTLKTDPSRFGTGLRGRDNTDNIHNKIGVPYTSAVLEGAAYTEVGITDRPNKFIGSLDPTKIFDGRDLRNTQQFQDAQDAVLSQYGPDFSAAVAQMQSTLKGAGFDAVLFPNGQLRIFTAQDVSVAPTGSKIDIGVSRGLIAHRATGWSATNMVDGQDARGQSGYLVALKHIPVLEVGEGGLAKEHLSQYVADNQSELNNPANVLSTYTDGQDNFTGVNVSVRIQGLEQALQSARAAGLLSVVDGRTGMEIPVSHPVFDIAHTYNKRAGLPSIGVVPFEKIDPVMGETVAAAYTDLEVSNTSPEVTGAYEQFGKEIEAQFRHAGLAGITMEAWPNDGQPYANSAEMRADVFENNHLFVFARELAHPNLTDEQQFMFRAIHDLFGHAKTGFEFGANGELNATLAHAQMFSDKATKAMFTETVGQNSWVNFGPDRALPVAERRFAPQKADLLPQGIIDSVLKQGRLHRAKAQFNVTDMLTSKGQEALLLLRTIVGVPENLDIQFTDSLIGPEGQRASGSFFPAEVGDFKALISLAYDSNDILSTAAHEGFHYLDEHVLAPRERTVLRNSLKVNAPLYQSLIAHATLMDQKHGTNVVASIEGSAAEARAYAFQYWRNGALSTDGQVQTMFQKLKTFVKRIFNAVQGLGFQTHEDIFNAIDRGSYAVNGTTAMNHQGLGPLYEVARKNGEGFIGGPKAIKNTRDLKAYHRKLEKFAIEAEEYKMWYERSSTWALQEAGGNQVDARKIVSLLALYSSGVTVASNFTMAMNAWRAHKDGKPVEKGFDPKQIPIAQAILDAPDGRLQPNALGDEIPGDKRNNFFKNLMIMIDPVNYGPHTQGITIDRWMARMAGFGSADGVIGKAQYRFVEEQMALVARKVGMPGWQLQAAVWVNIKARMDASRDKMNAWADARNMREIVAAKPGRIGPEGKVIGARTQKTVVKKEFEEQYATKWLEFATAAKLTEALLAKAGFNYADANTLSIVKREEAIIKAASRASRAAARAARLAAQAPLFSVDNSTAPTLPDEHQPMLSSAERLIVENEDNLRTMHGAMTRGDAQHAQMNHRMLDAVDKAGVPQPTLRQLFQDKSSGFGGNVVRFAERNVMSLLKLSERSKGVANMAGVLFAHGDRKKRLIADSVEKNLSKWTENLTQADANVVSAALMQRTTGTFNSTTNTFEPILKGSSAYDALYRPLTEHQKNMFDQANQMVNTMLGEEFLADQKVYGDALGRDSEAYKTWIKDRQAQIIELAKNGYIPERRFGNFASHGFIETEQGNVTVFFAQHENQAAAVGSMNHLQKTLGTEFPNVKWEWGTKDAVQYDGTVSFLQFSDTARRLGIELTQGERERLARFTIAADSTRRNRIFRRLNIAGFSRQGERILAEFAVSIANKVAHAEFGGAVDDALKGFKVDIEYSLDGTPTVNVDRSKNEWKHDGTMSGHYKNLMSERANYVLNAQHDRSDWSSKLRSLASMHFLGGSLAAMGVQLTSLPMFTVPWLFQYTGVGEAYGRVTGAFATTLKNLPNMVDLSKLENRDIKLPGVDEEVIDGKTHNVGLRDALIRAARDGTILDTELYQIMGMARGSLFSHSKFRQKAIEGWMLPFRTGEHINRLTTFQAAYHVAQKLNDQGKLPTATTFDFAKNATLRTQFRYDEANRPGLAHSNLGAMLFVFRSFPLYALEMITTLHKQSPKAATFALFSLWVAAGTEGLPFASNILDIIQVISQRLFGSSFNPRRAMRNITKDASEAVLGADMSGLVTHGAVNYLTGMQFSSRLGLGEIIPGTRLGAADTDYKRFMEDVLGPIGSMVGGAMGGVDKMTRGQFMDGFKEAAPIAARNAVKGFDYWTKGVAEDKRGRFLKDVSHMEAFAQSAGFSSASLAEAYHINGMVRQDLAFYNQVRGDMMDEVISAIRDGRRDDITALMNNMAEWNRSNPNMPIILNAASVQRSLMLAGLPLNQRTLLMLPRALRNVSNQEILGLGNQ